MGHTYQQLFEYLCREDIRSRREWIFLKPEYYLDWFREKNSDMKVNIWTERPISTTTMGFWLLTRVLKIISCENSAGECRRGYLTPNCYSSCSGCGLGCVGQVWQEIKGRGQKRYEMEINRDPRRQVHGKRWCKKGYLSSLWKMMCLEIYFGQLDTMNMLLAGIL